MVDLPGHDPKTFDSYMQCVYFGTVTAPDLPEYAGTNSITGLIALYLLADKLEDLTTANLTIDEIIKLSEESKIIPSRRAIALAYKSTVAGSPLRKLCRDYCVHEASYEYTEDLRKVELPREFLHDVLLEFKKIALRSGPRGQCKSPDDVFWNRCVDREKCYYHQHNKGHPKCSEWFAEAAQWANSKAHSVSYTSLEGHFCLATITS